MTPRDPLFREDWEPGASDVERIVARIEASALTVEQKRHAVDAMRRSVRPREPGEDDDDEQADEGEGNLVTLGSVLEELQKRRSETDGARRGRFSKALDDIN